MSRSIKDILTFLIQIELNFSKLYTMISVVDGQYSGKLKTIAAVLAREEASHYELYRELLEEGGFKDIKVEDEIFEVMRKNLDSFKNSISYSNIYTDVDLIQTAYDYELENGVILWTIYSSIKEGKNDEERSFVKLLEDLIKIEESHAANLKPFIKN